MFTSSRFIYIIALALPLVFCCHLIMAQEAGCTDPLANNFDESAEVNDGSCVYPFTTYQPERIGELPNAVRETSGLLLIDTCLWTHNDSGFGPELHCLDTTDGHLKRTVWIDGATSRDWEDIAMDEEYIYIGDFGNNNGNRRDLAIFRIKLAHLDRDSIESEGIFFEYPDQVDFDTRPQNNDYDMEAMIAIGDSLYLFSKNWVDLRTRVYALPKAPGTYTADLIDSFAVNGLITGADYNEEKGVIMLVGYTPILTPFIWLLWDFPNTHFFAGNKRRIELSLLAHQVEAVVWNPYGKYWFISNEAFSQIVNVPPRLHRVYTDQWFFEPTTSVDFSHKVNTTIQAFPNPCHDTCYLDFDLLGEQTGRLTIFDVHGKPVKEGTIRLDSELFRLDMSAFPSGIYIVFVDTEDQIFSARIVKE